ncbi:MAG: urea ABC transporter ATP-binding subunit UrtE [Pseudomonadota bacterium]
MVVSGLNQYYGGSHILRDVNLDAEVGKVTCVLGRNGVGKTTLLRCIMGVVPPKTGSVSWSGSEITRLAPHERVARGVAYVPQGREIFARLTVEENLRMGMARFPGSKARHIPAFVYETFPVLADMKHRRGGDLSGGQQQQLAIARALVSEPKLLILDEPTEGIQPSIIKLIGGVIRQLAARGDMAILLVEQYYDFAAELADSYAVMARGTVIKSGLGRDMAADGVRDLLAI